MSKYRITQLEKDLWAIEEDMVRCFLLLGEEDALLIDACAGGGEAFMEAVLSLTKDRSLRFAITHADPDHIAGFPQKAAVMMHPTEYMRFQGRNTKEQTVLPVWDGDSISVGDRTLEIMLLPGHTPGNIALLDKQHGDIFIGDSVQTNSAVFMFGDGRNLEAYIASLARLNDNSSQYSHLYSCHGDTVVSPAQIPIQLEGALQLQAGKLTPQNPPFDMPCKLYSYQGAAYLY
jgi:glyoxylase-like metal-dependent hydrolase (beta-lactamase superfamily II)